MQSIDTDPKKLLHAALTIIGLCAAAAVMMHGGHALAQARNPFSVGISEGGGPATGFAGWILAEQAYFEQLLSSTIKATKTEASAGWTLAGISFAYGVFHAAGPGHGKVVMSSYMYANRLALWRGLVLSLLAAILQGVVAICIIGILALVLHATAARLRDTASFVETVSFAAVMTLGLWMVWRKGRAFYLAWRETGPVLAPVGPSSFAPVGMAFSSAGADGRSGAGSAAARTSSFVCEEVDPSHVHSAACGHFHAPDPRTLGDGFTWKSAVSTVLAAGLRPCSGAILVLVFAMAQGIFWVGVGSTFAMSLGTAITTGALAAMAVFAKSLTLRFTGETSRRGILIARGLEVLAALLVFVVGAALLAGYSNAIGGG